MSKKSQASFLVEPGPDDGKRNCQFKVMKTSKAVLELVNYNWTLEEHHHNLLKYIDNTIENPQTYGFFRVVRGKNINYEEKIDNFLFMKMDREERYYVRIRKLQHSDDEKPNFSGIESVATFYARGSSHYNWLTQVMNWGYQWYRQIRGDGDCYFRASTSLCGI